MNIELLDTGDPRWRELLSTVRYDVFHQPNYLANQDEFYRTRTQLIAVTEGDAALLVPVILKPLEDDRWDAHSPQVYASPLFSGAAAPEWRHDAITRMLEFLRQLGVVTLFLRSYPILDDGVREFAAFGAVGEHSRTFNLRLDRPLEEIRADMRSNHRRNIRKAHKSGQKVIRDTNWDHLDAFMTMYSATMERVEAEQDYRYPHSYFTRLRDELGESASLWLLHVDEEIAAGHLVTEVEGTVNYLFGATHPDFRRQAQQVVLFDSVLEWAHERGNRDYFLGGGGHESLLHFKAGLTSMQPRFETVRVIVDPVAYGRSCAEWEAKTGMTVGDMHGFFPPYRQPITQPEREREPDLLEATEGSRQ